MVGFDALILDGHLYPIHQFEVARPDRCDAEHWHAHAPARSIGLLAEIGTLGALNVVHCKDSSTFPAGPTLNRPDAGSEGWRRSPESGSRSKWRAGTASWPIDGGLDPAVEVRTHQVAVAEAACRSELVQGALPGSLRTAAADGLFLLWTARGRA
jgi:hypothetical protein